MMVILRPLLYYSMVIFFKNTAVSSTNQMLVVFTSKWRDSYSRHSGFYAVYSSCSVLTAANGSISSPNYQSNSNRSDIVCWIISQPVEYVIKLTLTSLQLSSGGDFFRVYDGNSTIVPLLLSADSEDSPVHVITSSSNQMLVVFTSDANNPSNGTRFSASYTAITCSVLTSANGSISLPNYQSNYKESDYVCWIISQPVGYVIGLSLDRPPLGDDGDWLVRVYDGNSTNARKLISSSGDNVPSRIIASSANHMLVVFTSDAYSDFSNGTGLSASYSSITCTVLTSAKGNISLSTYPIKNNTMVYVCWLISQPDDYVISVSIKKYSFQYAFRFFDGDSTNSTELNPGHTDVTSSANKMFIVLSFDAKDVIGQLKFGGLKVSYNSSSYSSFYSCSALTSASGNISANYQSRHDRYMGPYMTEYLGSVCWLISQPADYVISLSFNHFRLNGRWENVRVFDGSCTN